MNYSLKIYDTNSKEKVNNFLLAKKLFAFLSDQKLRLILAVIVIIINSIGNVAAPFIIGIAIDNFIQQKNISGLQLFSLVLVGVYFIVFVTSYLQTITMGRIGQNLLFKLRNSLFSKVQTLPLAFFNQNKLGDLISRINNDTDKLNQFFSQSLIQFVANFFTIVGVGIFIFFINIELAIVTLSSALLLFALTYFLSPWIAKQNRLNLQSLGGLSAEIQESLNNFKVIVSFDRRDYFRENFDLANVNNFKISVKSGIANNFTGPLFDLSSNIATLVVLLFGIYLVTHRQLTIGLLVSFLTYTDRFYSPLRQMASLWSSAQLSLAAWNRILEILILESDMPIIDRSDVQSTSLLQFKDVSFGYSEKLVIQNINMDLQIGKTYAIIGPTGGGKSTTASLMARLYDPISGVIYFEGRDIRSFERDQLSKKIGYILQDPYLFTGTVGENIAYGNLDYQTYNKQSLEKKLHELNLEILINKFDDGLDTLVTPSTENISLGQKQLISFIRAIIRNPSLLIMDEATANIDTVTETLLQNIIDKLPISTTKVIIAHRLNTIKKADEIFFVNNGHLESAKSFENSLELIMNSVRNS